MQENKNEFVNIEMQKNGIKDWKKHISLSNRIIPLFSFETEVQKLLNKMLFKVKRRNNADAGTREIIKQIAKSRWSFEKGYHKIHKIILHKKSPVFPVL